MGSKTKLTHIIKGQLFVSTLLEGQLFVGTNNHRIQGEHFVGTWALLVLVGPRAPPARDVCRPSDISVAQRGLEEGPGQTPAQNDALRETLRDRDYACGATRERLAPAPGGPRPLEADDPPPRGCAAGGYCIGRSRVGASP